MVARVALATILAFAASPALAEAPLPYDVAGVYGMPDEQPRMAYRLGGITGEHVAGPSSLGYARLDTMILETRLTAHDGWRLDYDVDPLTYVIVADLGGRPPAAAP
jgi:hypothetical protein